MEPTPFQRSSFLQLVQNPASLLISVAPGAGQYAFIAKRTAIAESQASGALLFDLKKTAARDAWNEIKPVFDVILQRMQFNVEKQ